MISDPRSHRSEVGSRSVTLTIGCDESGAVKSVTGPRWWGARMGTRSLTPFFSWPVESLPSAFFSVSLLSVLRWDLLAGVTDVQKRMTPGGLHTWWPPRQVSSVSGSPRMRVVGIVLPGPAGVRAPPATQHSRPRRSLVSRHGQPSPRIYTLQMVRRSKVRVSLLSVRLSVCPSVRICLSE